MKRVGIAGAAGRMGRALVSMVLKHPGLTLAAAWERPGHPLLGSDAGELAGVERAGVALAAGPEAVIANCEVVIDFTAPEATVALARLAVSNKCSLVVGTTGLNEEQKKVLQWAAENVGVIYSANFSLGVNLLSLLVEQAAAILDANYDIEIVEAHHNQKKDAPSGTAIMLYNAACSGRELDSATAARHGREGLTGVRTQAEIGMHAVRGGDIVGDHTVLFAGPKERLEFKHQAHSREVFAGGAVRAAAWLCGQKHGWYSMADVLGLAKK